MYTEAEKNMEVGDAMFLILSPRRGDQVAIKQKDLFNEEERVEHDDMYSSGEKRPFKTFRAA